MNNKIYNFNESLEIGKSGEDIVCNWLINNYPNITIADVTDNESYRKMDTDYIIKFNNMEPCLIEIKTDVYDSGNIFFETYSNYEHGTPGCMYVTKAKYIFYYFVKFNDLFILETEPYINWFNKNKELLTTHSGFKSTPKYVRNKSKYGNDEFYHSEGYAFDRELLRNESFCKVHTGINN